MKRDTIGKIAQELMQKDPESRDPIELERQMHKDYEKNIIDALNNGFKRYDGDFFIVVDTKKEPLMNNVIRNFFYPRQTCPTPNYDQTVYMYDAAQQNLTFLWVIPSRDTCFLLKDNALRIAPEERELLEYVLAFDDGSLYIICKNLNGEKEDSIELAN